MNIAEVADLLIRAVETADFDSAAPFVQIVPRDTIQNIEFREACVRLGDADPTYAEILWEMCSHDTLFLFNVFYWTIDPRPTSVWRTGKSPESPFITYNDPPKFLPYKPELERFQDSHILEVERSIEEGEQQVHEKSREQGGSWDILGVYLKYFIFRSNVSFMLGSKKEENVDKGIGEVKTLMGKIDFLLQNLPTWIISEGEYFRKFKLFRNLVLGGTISGEATNENFAVSGRETSIFLDEFGKVREPMGSKIVQGILEVADSILYLSTSEGEATAFYQRRKAPDVKVLQLHWTLHRDKAAGLYHVAEDRSVTILDTEYTFPPGFEFRNSEQALEETGDKMAPWRGLRSPWFDGRCDRYGNNLLMISRELSINHGASGGQFYPNLAEIEKYHASLPVWEGDIIYDPMTARGGELIERAGGPLRLWVEPHDGRLTGIEPLLSADISMGTGASNSVLSLGCMKMAKKIGTYVTAHMGPEKFGRLSAAIGWWLQQAGEPEPEIIPEANGPGRTYMDSLKDVGYYRIWKNRNEKDDTKRASTIAGFWMQNNKDYLLGAHAAALVKGDYVTPDADEYDECGQYILQNDRTPVFSGELMQDDPSGAGANHGDRVISSALLWHAMRARKGLLDVTRKSKDSVPENSYMGRRLAWERENDPRKIIYRY